MTAHAPAALACAACLFAISAVAEQAETWKFDFGSDAPREGYIHIPADRAFSAAGDYGFENTRGLHATDAYVTSEEPFFFSAAVPEGIYRVTVTLAGGMEGSVTTCKAEARRLMLEHIEVPAETETQQSFAVYTWNDRLPGGGSVSMKEGRRDTSTWDDKLTIEFNGTRPSLSSIEIEPAPTTTTLFIAGDSTVKDQPQDPWTGWGQMLPRFFNADVAVANHSESGRTLRSFRGQKRLDKILSQIKPGDYVFIQFGHNDMKEKGEGVGPFESYTDDLKSYVAAVRDKKGQPVLLTPMNRRWWEGGEIKNTHGDYPEAVRRVARSENVPLIDLHAMSKPLFESMGEKGSARAFVHYPANSFPNQKEAWKDNSHFSPYGGYELAKCVVEGIRDNSIPLSEHLRSDVEHFDPSQPDTYDDFDLPYSPLMESETPEGS